MSYQDRIYDQNGKIRRNSTVITPNTSSDVCVFTYPSFYMVGGDKIDCADISCEISGVSFNNILSATTECFTINQLSGTCFNNIEWSTRIYEDKVLVYDTKFYTSNNITGDTPTFNQFSGTVTTAFNELGYDYTLNSTNYIINQIYGVNNVRVEIRTELNYEDNCPVSGMTGTTFTGTCNNTDTIICDESFNGLISSDHNVFPITGQTNIDLEFIFTGNTNSFIDLNTEFKFEIYKFNNILGYFNQPPVYTSNLHKWGAFSGTSAFTESVPVSSLKIDGNYLIKGSYRYGACTEFAKLIGLNYNSDKIKTGDRFQLYNTKRDYYFTSFLNADIPFIEIGEETNRGFGALNVLSKELDGKSDLISYPSYKGDLMINLNGITLSKDLDYSFENIGPNGKNVLKLSGSTVSGDVLTFVYTNTDGSKNNIKQDIIDVTSTIPSGPINGQGNNPIYYNTTTSKYELYTDIKPATQNDVVVTLNGVTLANNIDYYLSISNPKRIILEGDIFIGDIINIWYNVNIHPQGDVYSSDIMVAWSIDNAPQDTNGKFTLELSTNKDFTNIVNSVEVVYVKNQIGYAVNLGLVGNNGDKLYYRIKNDKKFIDVCGGPLTTTAFSEIIDIILQTNSTNSY